jgi:radical SAM superfamily enzyme YgiQ (UPF0313 family)
MLSIGIIIPSVHYWSDPGRITPIHELYLATLVESKGDVAIEIIDLRGVRSDQQIYHIPKRDLYLYWVMKAGDYNNVRDITKQLRFFYPTSKHVAGGTHIDNSEIESPESFECFDSVIIGPSEDVIESILQDCKNKSLNKMYKSDYQNVPYENYPFMRRHFLPETAIVNHLLFEKYGSKIRSTCVLFSRGCCFRCKYCTYNVPKFVQMRTSESIKEEIKYLKDEYKIEAINLKDEICIPISDEKATSFLKALEDSNIMWRGQTCVTGLTEAKIALAKKSGCVELALGIESASQQVLDIIGKKITLEQVKNAIKLCKKYDIKVKMCLIFGLPGEPKDILEITKSFVNETKPDWVSLSGFDPILGSEIYTNYKSYGIKDIDKNWDKHAHLLYRFSDKEEVGVPFEYEKINQWGETFSREEIIENIRQMQHYLRERNMLY